MQKVSRIFQILFKYLLIFFITFIWVRYFIKSLWQAVLISIAITVIINFIMRIITNKKNYYAILKKTEREEAENMFLTLTLNKNALPFYFKLVSSRHSCEKKSNFVLINHSESKVALYPHNSFNPVSPDDIANIINKVKKYNPTKLVIPCFTATKEAFSFAKNFDMEIIILDQYETYQKLFKAYNIFPSITDKYKKDKRLAFKDLAMFSLNKARAKGYFFSAIILVLSSFFVRANLYYCIVASILVMLAIISIYDPFSRNKPKTEIL